MSVYFFGDYSGWLTVPPPDGTNIQLYRWLVQFWLACRERAWAIGSPVFPATNHIWASGTVSSLVNNGDGTWTVNDPAANGGSGWGVNRFAGYSLFGSPWIPANYDLVFDDLDPEKVVRSSITSNTAFAYVINDDFSDYLTSKFLTSISSLSGKRYYIIPRGGIWWSERWLQWPNDQESWLGSVTVSTTGSTNPPVPATMQDTSASWAPNRWQTGYELMTEGNDGRLHRVTITGNTSNTLQYAPQTWEAVGNYAIVAAGNKWRGKPDSRSGQWTRWYGGNTSSYWTHEPDDTIGATQEPTLTMQFFDGGGFPFNVNSFDQDVWTSWDDSGDSSGSVAIPGSTNGYDLHFSDQLYATFRGLQVWLESVCGAFVEKKSYEGAAAIPTLVPATFFKAANINAFTSTTTTVGTFGGVAGIGVSAISLPFTPISVYYAVLDSTGTPMPGAFGIGTMPSNSFLEGSFISPDNEGQTIVISLGWTRDHEEKFLYMYPKTCFFPDYSTGPTTIYDPPTTSNPGVWQMRPASTNYKEHDAFGFVRDSNGFRPFTTDIFARYDGDNFNDPTIRIGGIGSGEPVTGASPIVSYEDKFFEGKRSPGTPSLGMSGIATGGSYTQLTDANQQWWQNNGVPMRTETGTADSGSTTSLGDSSKAGNALWNAATGRWAGFVLKITQGGTVYRRPIASMSGTTLSWTDPLPATASGCAYAIDEPKYELNRFQGRTLIVSSNGQQVRIPILYSDDHTLYFASQSIQIGAGTSYRIEEFYPGGVWARDPGNTKWIVPTGPDPRTGVLWHANQTENLPTRRRDYGRMNKEDYFSENFFTELQNAINALEWIKWTMVWTSRANPAVPEINQDGPEGVFIAPHNHGEAENGWTDGGGFHPGAITQWGDPAFESEADGQRPFAFGQADNGFSGTCYGASYGRRYAYGKVSGILGFEACAVDYYAYSLASDGTGSNGVTTTPCTPKQTFNAEGDGVLYQQFHLFATTGPSTASTQISAKLGSLSIPSDPGQPTSGSHCSWFDGYQVIAEVAILRFNVAGGFVFQ